MRREEITGLTIGWRLLVCAGGFPGDGRGEIRGGGLRDLENISQTTFRVRDTPWPLTPRRKAISVVAYTFAPDGLLELGRVGGRVARLTPCKPKRPKHV